VRIPWHALLRPSRFHRFLLGLFEDLLLGLGFFSFSGAVEPALPKNFSASVIVLSRALGDIGAPHLFSACLLRILFHIGPRGSSMAPCGAPGLKYRPTTRSDMEPAFVTRNPEVFNPVAGSKSSSTAQFLSVVIKHLV